MLIFTGSLVFVVIAAFIQMTNWILIGATIKPNLLFVVLVILTVINFNWIKRLVLVLIAALIVKESPGLALPNLVFVGATLSSIVLLDILPWQRIINALVAVAAGTILVNLQYFVLLPVIYELAMNLLLTLVLFNMLQPINVPQIKLQRHRF